MNRIQDLHAKRGSILRKISERIRSTVTGGSTHEVAIVRRMHHSMVDLVNRDLQPMFALYGFQLAAGSVFVHQSPKVRGSWLKHLKEIEIGDILFIRTYISIQHHIERMALLLQAKKDFHKQIRGKEEDQLELYRVWPEFIYTSPRPLTGHIRQVTGPDLYNGAKYLLLEDSSYPYAVVADPADVNLINRRRFSLEFYDLLFGNAGREFCLPVGRCWINWDQVIEDLLLIIAPRISKTLHGEQRGYGLDTLDDLFSTTLTDLTTGAGGFENVPPNKPRDQRPQDDEAGFLVIEIAIQEMG